MERVRESEVQRGENEGAELRIQAIFRVQKSVIFYLALVLSGIPLLHQSEVRSRTAEEFLHISVARRQTFLERLNTIGVSIV